MAKLVIFVPCIKLGRPEATDTVPRNHLLDMGQMIADLSKQRGLGADDMGFFRADTTACRLTLSTLSAGISSTATWGVDQMSRCHALEKERCANYRIMLPKLLTAWNLTVAIAEPSFIETFVLFYARTLGLPKPVFASSFRRRKTLVIIDTQGGTITTSAIRQKRRRPER